MREVFRVIEKLIFPLLLAGGGLFTVLFYTGADIAGVPQQPEMILGGMALIASGVFMGLVFLNVMKNKWVNIIMTVFLIITAVIFLYKVTMVILNEKNHKESRDASYALTVQRLKDLRFSQEKYREYNKFYTPSYDTLKAFLKEKNIPVPYRNGNVLEDKWFQEQGKTGERNNYIIHRKELAKKGFSSEEAAVAAHYEVRDTSYISHEEKYFSKEYREKKNLPPVTIDDLPFNPWSGERFMLEYRLESDSTKKRNEKEVYLKVTDPTPHPIDQNDLVVKDTLTIGSLESAVLDGNWTD